MARLTYKHGDDDNGVCLVVQDIEQYHKRLKDVEEDGSN